MRRIFGRLFLVVPSLALLAMPLSAAADSLSSSQNYVVKASVAPAREIVVNKYGHLLAVYSNTNDAVVPSVHLGSVNGKVMASMPAVLASYNQLVANQPTMVGVKLVPPKPKKAAASEPSLARRIGVIISSLSQPRIW